MPTLGPTGEFPNGRAGDTDEGALTFGISADHRHGIVRLEFGSLIKWIGFPSEQARALARALDEKADELDRRKG